MKYIIKEMRQYYIYDERMKSVVPADCFFEGIIENSYTSQYAPKAKELLLLYEFNKYEILEVTFSRVYYIVNNEIEMFVSCNLPDEKYLTEIYLEAIKNNAA